MEKGPDAFRIISEVADDLDVPQHVLRFWESRFPQIKPMKRGGGRRYYRPDDVDLLRGIRHLLYSEGYTIRGVQRILREEGVKFVQVVWQDGAPQPSNRPFDSEAEGEGAQRRGILALLPGFRAEGDTEAAPRGEDEASDDEADAAQPVGPASLGVDQVRQLQAVLADLTECRRLIDAVLAQPEAAAPDA